MKLTITNFLFLGILTSGGGGCGASLVSDQVLTIEMYGISKAPASATGDRDPNFQSYQLLGVNLISADGSSVVKLFDNEDERKFRIIDRPQIIYSKQIAEFEGTTYGGMQVIFNSSIEGGEQSGTTFNFTMSTPIQVLSKVFAVEKAKDLDALIKINWGNTISDAGMSEPDYEITLP